MGWLVVLGVAAVVVPLGVLAQRRGWIDLSGRTAQRTTGGAFFAVADELFAPTAHAANQERDRAASLPVEAPVPGDRGADRDEVYSGRVRITVPPR